MARERLMPALEHEEMLRVAEQSFLVDVAMVVVIEALVHRLETEIHHLEARQTELTAELEKPDTYEKPGQAAAINRELVGIQDRLAEITPQWEEAATKLGVME